MCKEDLSFEFDEDTKRQLRGYWTAVIPDPKDESSARPKSRAEMFKERDRTKPIRWFDV